MSAGEYLKLDLVDGVEAPSIYCVIIASRTEALGWPFLSGEYAAVRRGI